MMLYTCVALIQLSLFAPPAAEAPTVDASISTANSPPTANTPPPAEDAEYRGLVLLLEQGITLGDESPDEAVTMLEVALAGLPDFAPRLANDPKILALRASAQVSLARSYLLLGDEVRAIAMMDEAIRSSLGEPVPVDIYGPSMKKLWLERSSHASQHPGQVVVLKCTVNCQVYINERRVDAQAFPALTAGTYRLWVEPVDASFQPMRRTLLVGPGDETLTISFGPPPPSAERMVDAIQSYDRAPARANERDQAVMSRGMSAMAAGGVLLVLGGVGAGVGFGVGVRSDSLGGALGLIVLGGFSAIAVLPSGLVTLIAGGASYGVAKRHLHQTGSTRLHHLSPTFTRFKGGGSFGVAFAF